MKISLTVLTVVLTFFLVVGSIAQGSQSVENHADCLTIEDVAWYTDRSKSGIARTCTNSILQKVE